MSYLAHQVLVRRKAICLIAAVLSAAALVWAYGPATSPLYKRMEAQILDAVMLLVPAGLEDIGSRAAEVFLTPWLYLTLLVAWLAERFFPVNPDQRFFSTGMVYDFVMWFVLGSLLRIVVLGVFIGVLTYVFTHHLAFAVVADAAALPAVVQVILGLVLVDFLNYFHHYLRHKVPLLWSFHAIHHSQREMNVFTDLRVHLVEYLVAKPIVLLPLFILGMGEIQIAWLVILLTAYSHLYHGNIRSHFGPLRHVLVTPQSHRIHHSADPRHCDRNFGVIFCCWDRLFGTHWHDHTEYPETGVYDQAFPYEQSAGKTNMVLSFIQQFLYPFRVILHAAAGKGWKLDGTQGRRHAREEKGS